MGVKKSRGKSKIRSAKTGNLIKTASSIGSRIMGGSSAKKSSGGYRRSNKQTPERLAKKLLVIKLQKKIYKMKYGGR